ncbi:MAG: hypothetical protein AAB394_00945 [Patescibacteria group bacterium]
MEMLLKNKLIIFLTILIGLLYIGPSLMIWENFNKSGNQFISIQHKKNSPEMQQYLARAREIYDGHFPPSEIYGFKQVSTVQNILPPTLFASLVFLFRGNINLAHLGALFLFSAIIFILFNWLGHIMFNSRLKSLFFALIAVLTPVVNIAKESPFFGSFIDFKLRFINSFLPFVMTQFNQLPLDRFDEPLLTYPIYLSAIIFFIIFWQNPRMVTAIFSGFFAGLLYYTYFHHWVYWTTVLGILYLYVLFFKGKDKSLTRNYLILFGVLAVTIIPYFINYFSFVQTSGSQYFSLKVGAMHGRYFGITGENIIDYVLYALLGILVYLMYWQKDRHKAVLFLGFILSMFAVWNIQLITGIVPIEAFFRRTLAPLIFLILFNLFYDLVVKLEIKWPQTRKYVAMILITLVVFVITKNVVNMYLISCCTQPHIIEYNKLPDGILNSWNWINGHLEHEPKIISSSILTSLYLPGYTSARPFLPTAYLTLLSMEETDRRYLESQKLFAVNDDALRNIDLDMVYGFYFLARYGSFSNYFPNADNTIIDQKKAEKVEELMRLYKDMAVFRWKDVNADYVYVGPWEKETVGRDFSKDKNIELVYQNSFVEIYRILR